MTLLADENVDVEVVLRLRSAGHQVFYVAEMEPGIRDDLVLDRATDAGALLLTADKDFGELVFRQNRATAGVVLIRLAGVSADKKAETVSKAFVRHYSEFQNCFSVISANRVRIRPRGKLRDLAHE